MFENVHRINEEAKNNKKALRVSIDCKATVNLGDFSRGGKSRGKAPVKALDHDMATKSKLIPFGILNLENDQLHIFYGNSNKTSDFVCDAFEWWWDLVKEENPEVEEIVIFADNGPENNSHRTQYLSRLVRFSQSKGLKIHGVYYPPYHSKYNPIERRWSSLENHWSGTLLNTVSTVLKWTETMTWKAMSPVVNLLDKFYPKGVRLGKSEMTDINPYIIRNPKLPKWDMTVVPESVVS
ncbi:transposase [Endozoicomonas sp. 4G]|uniref:ISAzo13-like element transposase-related protein n=1 Tax=Endozoicomonas sp. 4G TaxID=2872754 RepID=UPI002078F12A|nr:transposase [Endozoicomonas sp. 4G]